LGDVGRTSWTTISEMELVAAVQALRSLRFRARIDLHSDSEYLIYGMRAFVSRWHARAGGTAGNELQHRELWTELIALDARLAIRWKWIKVTTASRPARADELAYEAARSLWVQEKVAA